MDVSGESEIIPCKDASIIGVAYLIGDEAIESKGLMAGEIAAITPWDPEFDGIGIAIRPIGIGIPRDWLDAILWAVFAALIIRTFLFEMLRVKRCAKPSFLIPDKSFLVPTTAKSSCASWHISVRTRT